MSDSRDEDLAKQLKALNGELSGAELESILAHWAESEERVAALELPPDTFVSQLRAGARLLSEIEGESRELSGVISSAIEYTRLRTVSETRSGISDGASSVVGQPAVSEVALTGRDPELAIPTLLELQPGYDLGSYRIVRKLGQGGMGLVFLAEHRRMARQVALKVLPPSASGGPGEVERFQREVQALARLSHPHIVAAHDADEARGLHFLVMEYVDGSDLAALVRQRGPLAVDVALDYVTQAAQGLEYAHGQGLIHRDVKPSNLLVDLAGYVKVLDLGLARMSGPAEAGSSDLTAVGSVLGTIDYMAPEQASNTRAADIRSDVYSLGCTLFYLLTGRSPYRGETALERILAHEKQPIPSVRAMRPDVPEGVDAVLRCMLAKQPAQRWKSMTEVLAGLSELRAGRAVSERPRGPHWPVWAAGGVGGLVLAAVGWLATSPDRSATESMKAISKRTESTKVDPPVRDVAGANVRNGGSPTHAQVVAESAMKPNRAISDVVANGGRPSPSPGPAAKEASPVAGESSESPDRKVASHLLSRGHRIEVRVNGERKSLGPEDRLPGEAFRLERVDARPGLELTDEDLIDITRCRSLRSLVLPYQRKLTKAGFAEIQRLTMLEEINLDSVAAVDNAVLEQLSTLPRLNWLCLNRCGMSDDDLAHLSRMHQLNTLSVSDKGITIAGLRHLQNLPLQHLGICVSSLDYADLEEFPRLFPRLTSLLYREPFLGDASSGIGALGNLTELSRLTPCLKDLKPPSRLSNFSRLEELILDDSSEPFTREMAREVAKAPRLMLLHVSGRVQVSSGAIAELDRSPHLSVIELQDSVCSTELLQEVSQVGGLVAVGLNLSRCTPEGLKLLQTTRPDIEIRGR